MSNYMISLARKHSRSKGTARVVMLLLADHHGARDPFPSIDLLAQDANVDRSNVKTALDRLTRMGEIEKVLRPGHSNVYKIKLACPDGCTITHPGGAEFAPTRGARGGEFAPPGGPNSAPIILNNPQPPSSKGRGRSGRLEAPARTSTLQPDLDAATAWEHDRQGHGDDDAQRFIGLLANTTLTPRKRLSEWRSFGRGPGGHEEWRWQQLQQPTRVSVMANGFVMNPDL